MPKRNPWMPYLIVVGALLLLWGYTKWRDSKYEVEIRPIFSFKAESVTGFKITKDNVSVNIVKRDTVWAFASPDTGHPEKYKIDEFVRDFLKGERERSITDDTANYAKYGVNENKSTRVELMNGDEIITKIYVGRSESDYLQEYVLLENDPNVYPVRQKLLNRLGAVASWWR